MLGISGIIKKLSNKNSISVPDDKEALDILKDILIVYMTQLDLILIHLVFHKILKEYMQLNQQIKLNVYKIIDLCQHSQKLLQR